MELAGETSCARSQSGLSTRIKKQQVRPTSDGYHLSAKPVETAADLKSPAVRNSV